MARVTIPLIPLHQLTPGQYADFFVVLATKRKGTTREGKPYYSCQFRDARRAAAAMIWGDSPWFEACEREWLEGQFYKLRAVYSEHERYGPQVELHNIRVVNGVDKEEGFDPAQIVESSRQDSDALFNELIQLVDGQIKDEPLGRLALALLRRFEDPIKELPASERTFYPFRGGWLEHVCSVTKTCLMLADHYVAKHPELSPPLNRDLVVAGAVLHDLGRVIELNDGAAQVAQGVAQVAQGVVGAGQGTPQPTVPGKLFGHVLLGRDLVRDAAREIEGLNPELVQLLEHMILSHLTLPEWGSPRLPLIPEVLILHHADDLDAKMEMYARCLSRDATPGPFTARDPILNKPLLKRRSV